MSSTSFILIQIGL